MGVIQFPTGAIEVRWWKVNDGLKCRVRAADSAERLAVMGLIRVTETGRPGSLPRTGSPKITLRRDGSYIVEVSAERLLPHDHRFKASMARVLSDQPCVDFAHPKPSRVRRQIQRAKGDDGEVA